MPGKLKRLLAANLKRLRTFRALTQEELAEASDISKNYLAEIETERKYPSDEVFERLASALGIEPWLLIYPQDKLAAWLEGNRTQALETWVLSAPSDDPQKKLLLALGEAFAQYAALVGKDEPNKR